MLSSSVGVRGEDLGGLLLGLAGFRSLKTSSFFVGVRGEDSGVSLFGLSAR